MRPSRLFTPLLIAAFLSACSSNPSVPTEADARAAVEQDIKAFSQGCIKLVDFHKTGEKLLESVMLVNATARIEFLEDCIWPIDTTVAALRIAPGGTPNVRKGEQRTVNLTLQFHKTDRDWKATTKNEP
jgi:hypothetical protein